MFVLKKWNGEYGKDSGFVVQNKQTGKFAEYRPSEKKENIAWVDEDLTKNPKYKSWGFFEDEPLEKLEDISM